MALVLSLQVLLLLWLSTGFRWTFVDAQTTVLPSNSTLDRVDDNKRIVLLTKKGKMVTICDIDTAIAASRNIQPNVMNLQAMILAGNLVHTTPLNVQQVLAPGDFAFISCDPADYTGQNLGIQQTISLAYSQVNPESTSNNLIGAVILYSANSAWCDISPAPISSQNIGYYFTMLDANASSALVSALSENGPGGLNSSIRLFQLGSNLANGTTLSNGSAGDDDAPSTTTNVAMIILYSVTGIITLLFLLIVLFGAFRAHQNPARYGPQALRNGQRQTRVRGIARAVLDTMPIIKYGERRPEVNGAEENVMELSNVNPEATAAKNGNLPSLEHSAASKAPVSMANANDTAQDAAFAGNTEGEEGSKREEHEDKSANSSIPTEADPVCSVCTSDFIRGEDIRVLPCGHSFHAACVDPWLLKVSGTCPLCRIDLNLASGKEAAQGEGSGPNDSGGSDQPTPSSTTPSESRRHLLDFRNRPLPSLLGNRRQSRTEPREMSATGHQSRPISHSTGREEPSGTIDDVSPAGNTNSSST